MDILSVCIPYFCAPSAAIWKYVIDISMKISVVCWYGYNKNNNN